MTTNCLIRNVSYLLVLLEQKYLNRAKNSEISFTLFNKVVSHNILFNLFGGTSNVFLHDKTDSLSSQRQVINLYF